MGSAVGGRGHSLALVLKVFDLAEDFSDYFLTLVLLLDGLDGCDCPLAIDEVGCAWAKSEQFKRDKQSRMGVTSDRKKDVYLPGLPDTSQLMPFHCCLKLF